MSADLRPARRPVLRSLTGRLLLWLLVPFSVLAALGLVDTYRDARETANAVLDRVLAGSALAIAERVVVNGDDEIEVDVPFVALEMLTSAAEDRVFYRVDGPPGTFVTGYRHLPMPDVPEGTRLARQPYFADAVYRGEPVRVVVLSGAASATDRSIGYRVAVAETTTARRALAEDILLRSALRQGLLIAIAATAVFFGVRRALRPLARLEEAVDRRTPDDLRPIRHAVPREVDRLVAAINGFMGRLSEALAALRRFTGNASHQIRTPLAIIRTQIELARRADDPETVRAALDVADAAVAQSERTLAQLLLLARIDEASADRLDAEAVDLADLARRVTARVEPRAARARLDLGFEAPDGPVFVSGQPMLLRELLSNLLENAILHAGAGHAATVRVTRAGGTACLEVEDDGPGIPRDQRARALKRFARLAPRTVGDSAGPSSGGTASEGAGHPAGDLAGTGAGLGLAIVDEIARLMGGRMALEASGSDARGRDVGLTVRIVFPAVSGGRDHSADGGPS
ncbi:sensor histidine kinase [Stappia sp.]|uniref:sensor histidine kinase n=1 Tax=Stappia sp. TaxID=1870903 RepID=UPI0032D950F5